MMKKTTIFLGFALLASPSLAQEYVHGYYRSNGTYAAPHWKSRPDSTVTNNYSFKGNLNPYTGQIGTKKYSHNATSPYYSGD